jgi:DNA-directed RNA polymerase I subunit RPA1
MKKHGEMCWDPTSLNFKMFSTDDIKQMSVCKVVTSLLFDPVGRPLPGGLYDPHMGACRNGEYCRTCSKPFTTCPGHLGYIELCMTAYNPLFTMTVLNILKISCLKCFRIQVADEKKAILDLQLTLLNAGFMIEAQELETLKQLTSIDEDVHKQLDKYRDLLAREPVNLLGSNKNILSLRQAIMSTSIKDCVTKKCIHCSMPMTKVKRTYKKMVISMNQSEVKHF